MSAISTNYRELRPDEIDAAAEACADAWQDPDIPMRQYELAVKEELKGFRDGKPCAPFDALVKCLLKLPAFMDSKPKLLDIGASGGYYSEVLRIAGLNVRYTGVDFSPAFKALAENLYQGIDFQTADARSLPYHDDWFDIVLSGAVLMHVREYEQAIKEAVRVSRKYVIFHRTPIVASGKQTTYFVKDAYSVPCIEIWFNEPELLSLFGRHGLQVIFATTVFLGPDGFCHRTYLCEKNPGLNHVQV